MSYAVYARHVFAYDTRLSVDPRVDLGALEASGQPLVQPVGDDKGLYQIDASAVLKVDYSRLVAASVDYDHYVQFRMPYTLQSHVLHRDPNGMIYTWTYMSIFGQVSEHYLDVYVSRAADASSLQWQLGAKQPGWDYDDNPAFTRLDGSWYMKPLPDGAIYVRYFLSAEFDTSIPDFIVSMVARNKLSDGVKGVIQALARQASLGR